MTFETETILIKLLEELKADFKELKTEVKDLRQDVNKVNNNQTRLEGKIETLSVQLEEKTKALQIGQDAINTRLSTQNTWQLSLITGLVIGLLALIGTIGKVVFFPNT